jgi:hypothetical protein
VPPGRLQPRRQRARRSVAEETKTPPLANAAAPPCGPNRIASVCAAVTTTETTAAVSLAVSAGVAAPWPPAAANRAAAAGSTSHPVTAKPARSSDYAMPTPIDPRPITAMRCAVIALSRWNEPASS